MNIYEQVTEYIRENDMLHKGDGVIAGISGGADSVCLLTMLTEYRKQLAKQYECSSIDALYIKAVHINHMIRGEEADGDESYVESLCKELEVDYSSYKEDIPKMAEEKHLTEEEAGRLYRYECFNKEAQTLEKQLSRPFRIAVAHNSNDLVETVLYNMIRGSALLGLTGIKPVRDRIIRPLLTTGRNDIEEYLSERGIKYRTDSTNLLTDYSRNKIRLQVLPLLREINAGADKHITDIAMDAARLAEDIDNEVSAVSNQEKPGEISIVALKKLSGMAAGELVLRTIASVCGRRKDITREHVDSVIRLIESESGKRVDLPYDMYAERVYDRIVIALNSEEVRGCLGRIVTSTFSYDTDLDISRKEYTKMIDCDKIKSTLELRTARPEDFIVINAKGEKKKLSRYFTAEKVERKLRSIIPVVADGDEIVWIVGMRLSERYKIGASTREVLEITYLKDDERKA